MSNFTYSDALNTLYGFINYELQRQDQFPAAALNLDRQRRLAALMGNPQDRYPVIHVAGTKGKGSVSAMCASVLQAAGYRVGLYTSPHMQDFRERFQINHDLISRETLAQLVYELRPLYGQVEGLTWFEATTALAFEYFAREKVDIAVIEVGLGGRLDSTNIVKPIVSVITSLSLDHTHILGDTLAEIASEKAGIIKPGAPVVSAPQPDEGRAVIERIAAERHAPLTLIGRDWQFKAHPPNMAGQTVTVAYAGREETYTTALIGEHQAINMAVALAALQQVEAAGVQIPPGALAQGLQQVQWPGRLEILQREPLVVADAAHNRASAHYLRQALDQVFTARPLILVFGAKSDKDIAGMLEELLPLADALIVAQAVDARAEDPHHITTLARQTGYTGEIITNAVVGEAVRQAMVLCGPQGMVCATGSLYIVGEARTELAIDPAQMAGFVAPSDPIHLKNAQPYS